MSAYSTTDLLKLRTAVQRQDGGPLAGIRMEDIPADEAERIKKKTQFDEAKAARQKEKQGNRSSSRGKEAKSIGPIMEAVPVDGQLLKKKRDALRRVENQTGAVITEKAGLRGRCTIIIQGTAAIVEKALPIVEALFDEDDEPDKLPPAPPSEWRPSVPPSDPPPWPDWPPPDLPSVTAAPPAAAMVPGWSAAGGSIGKAPGLSIEGDEDWDIPQHWAGDRSGPSFPPHASGQITSLLENGGGFWEGEYELEGNAKPNGSAAAFGNSSGSHAGSHINAAVSYADDGKGFWASDVCDAADEEEEEPVVVRGRYRQNKSGAQQDAEATAERARQEEVAAEERRQREAQATEQRHQEEAAAEQRRQQEAAAMKRREEDAAAVAAEKRRREEEAAAAAAAKRLRDEEAAAAAAEKRRQDEAAVAEMQRQEQAAAAAAEKKRKEEAAAAAAQKRRQDEVAKAAAAAAERKQQEEAAAAAAAEKKRQAEAGAAERKRQEEAWAAAAERRRQEEAAAAERKRLQEAAAAAAEKKRLDEIAAAASERKRQEEAAAAEEEAEEFFSDDEDVDIWAADPLQSLQVKTPPKAAPKALVAKGPPPGVKAKPPPPLPPSQGVKAKGPPPNVPAPPPVPTSGPARVEVGGEVVEVANFGNDLDSDRSEDEDGVGGKRKKKKKDKKKAKKGEVAKQEEPVSRPADPMAHLYSKTSFSGLANSDTEEEDEVLTLKGKPAAKGKSRPAETPKQKAALPAEAFKLKATPSDPSADPKKSILAKAPPAGLDPSVRPAVVAKPPPTGLEPAVGRPPPPPAPGQKAASVPAKKAGVRPPAPPAPKPTPSAWATPPEAEVARPCWEEDAKLAAMLQEEVSSDEGGQQWAAGVNRRGQPQGQSNKSAASSVGGASPAAMASRAKASKAAPKSKAKVAIMALNPLPQQRVAPKAMFNSSFPTVSSENAATSAKWTERPVEKIDFKATYEEEEDPELACYIWDRQAQRPKKDQRAVAAAPRGGGAVDWGDSAPPLSAARAPARGKAPPPDKQRYLLAKVMELGFDEQNAKRALNASNWAGLQEAVNILLG